MLYTNLKHIETISDFEHIVDQYENVVVVYGRMDPASVKSYRIAEELETMYPYVTFCDIEFDNPEMITFINTLEYYRIEDFPIVGYFKRGTLVNVSFGAQTKDKFETILRMEFELPVTM